jgi:catechol 2,3-dioxygenase-like lactoylglutathione lyase family enzyme
MKLTALTIIVEDQAKALAFYRDVLGFIVKDDIDMGGPRWITLESPEQPGGARVSLEPCGYPWAVDFQQAMKADGVPATAFAVGDIAAEYARLTAAGVVFRGEPRSPGPGAPAMTTFDDQCGNWIMLVEQA